MSRFVVDDPHIADPLPLEDVHPVNDPLDDHPRAVRGAQVEGLHLRFEIDRQLEGRRLKLALGEFHRQPPQQPHKGAHQPPEEVPEARGHLV